MTWPEGEREDGDRRAPASTISFLSDYGQADEFVGVVRSVLRRLAPGAVLVDLTHELPPHDVLAGALALRRSAPWLAPGVALAVVDPGVGTSRRAIVVEPADLGSRAAGPDGLVFVGPDNGLLLPAVEALGGAARAVALPPASYPVVPRVVGAPGEAGPTFDGRDVFAPAAAALARGADPLDLGTEIDPATLVPGPQVVSRTVPGGVAAPVVWVDRFGNAQLALAPDDGGPVGSVVGLELAGGTRASARRVRAFADLDPGEVGLVVDSSGLLALVCDRRSAARHLGVAQGDEVVLRPPGDDPDTAR
ncbi:MAG TPA: SAM-dependent chlorinase/fluorinase [Acidimicrobiales bacterium]|nr:SAM-dependent chlorinase/fluorinase [Acidimicrobiales bacterium]